MARFFRRYKSTIYGNYRKAYCVDGVLTGVCMSALMAIRDLIASKPMASPENYVTEIILAVGILWSTYQYRKQLPEGKVTFKELMLLGLGIGVVSAVVYGLWVWLNCGVLSPERVQYYNEQRMAVMDAPEQSAEAAIALEKVKAYTAGDWAFIGGFRSAVMSIIIAFFAALIFRTEKGTVVTKEQKTENSKQTQK